MRKTRFMSYVFCCLLLTAVNCRAVCPADIDQDGGIGIEDAILGLQVVSGQSPDIPTLLSCTDVNNDGAIGLAEAGYALRSQVESPPSCTMPVLPYDISQPTTVVGDGTPGSCTGESLQAAADLGGIIIFDCGNAPVTITLSDPVVFKKQAVLDGGGLVTLSGGNTTRILYLDSAYNLTTPDLVVQGLVFRDGSSTRTGDDTADGGGAIYRDGGSLVVIGCSFLHNRSFSTGQDLAGGAIYGFGGGRTVIVNSSFIGNSASNGGAVGSLNGDLIVVNSTFIGNEATGTGGNPGQGGCGGAIYMDGRDEGTILCGVTMAENRAGAIGGALFRVSNDNSGTFAMDTTTINANRVTADASGNAGGLYLQGLTLTVSNSTISRNEAFYNGGIWIHTCQVQLTNVTIAENTAFGSNGGGIWLSNAPAGTLLNCTIANNRSTAENQIAGAIFGAGLTLKNTLISYNEAMWVPGCNSTHGDEGGNFQWPDGALCTSTLTVADPLLNPLGYHGGPTETMLPASDSPAARSGSGCPAIDQRGRARSSSCTAGAIEIE